MLVITNKENSSEWLKNTSEVEGIENKDKILNSDLLKNIGDWNLDYFKYEVDSKYIGYAAGGYSGDKYLIVGFQIDKEYRSKNIGNLFFKDILNYLINTNKQTIEVSTRNDFMKKILLNNNFKYIYSKENSFLKDGTMTQIFQIKL